MNVPMTMVVEVPHLDDLLLHLLAGIDPPLIHWMIKIFLAQFWQQMISFVSLKESVTTMTTY